MAELNKMGEQHGDIRNDHLLIDAESELYRWIDFDYSVGHSDYDLWSLGNLIIFAFGKECIHLGTRKNTRKIIRG